MVHIDSIGGERGYVKLCFYYASSDRDEEISFFHDTISAFF